VSCLGMTCAISCAGLASCSKSVCCSAASCDRPKQPPCRA
jgi:hypothetical protein